MGVLGRILYSLLPKTLPGVVLVIMPVAILLVLLIYPKSVLRAFARDDTERLLKELLALDEGESKKKLKMKQKERPSKKGDSLSLRLQEEAAYVKVEKQRQQTQEKQDQEKDEEEQLIQLAILQNNKSQSGRKKTSPFLEEQHATVHSQPQAQTQAGSADDTALKVAGIETTGERGAEEGGWIRVPTKEEEIANSLRSKIQLLTKQLEASSSEASLCREALQKEQRRANDAEKELKERLRAHNLTFTEQGAEIYQLKSKKLDLETRLASLEERHISEQDKVIRSHVEKIHSLESAVEELSQACKNAEQTKDQNSQLAEKLAKARDQNNQLIKQLPEAEENLASGSELLLTEQLKTAKLQSATLDLEKLAEQEKSSRVALQSQNDEYKEEIKTLKLEIDCETLSVHTLQAREKELATKIKEAEVEIQAMGAASSESERAVGELSEKLSSVQDELEECKLRLEGAERQNRKLSEQLEKAELKTQIAIKVSDSKCAVFREEIAKIEAERQELLRKLDGIGRDGEEHSSESAPQIDQ